MFMIKRTAGIKMKKLSNKGNDTCRIKANASRDLSLVRPISPVLSGSLPEIKHEEIKININGAL